MPVAEEFFRVPRAVDERRIEGIAPGFEERIEQDRARGESAEVLKAQRHHRQRLGQTGKRALANRSAGLELAT